MSNDVDLDRLITAADAALYATALGRPLRATTIRLWKDRGRLAVRGHDARGVMLFRLSDVLDLEEQRLTHPRHTDTLHSRVSSGPENRCSVQPAAPPCPSPGRA